MAPRRTTSSGAAMAPSSNPNPAMNRPRPGVPGIPLNSAATATASIEAAKEKKIENARDKANQRMFETAFASGVPPPRGDPNADDGWSDDDAAILGSDADEESSDDDSEKEFLAHEAARTAAKELRQSAFAEGPRRYINQDDSDYEKDIAAANAPLRSASLFAADNNDSDDEHALSVADEASPTALRVLEVSGKVTADTDINKLMNFNLDPKAGNAKASSRVPMPARKIHEAPRRIPMNFTSSTSTPHMVAILRRADELRAEAEEAANPDRASAFAAARRRRHRNIRRRAPVDPDAPRRPYNWKGTDKNKKAIYEANGHMGRAKDRTRLLEMAVEAKEEADLLAAKYRQLEKRTRIPTGHEVGKRKRAEGEALLGSPSVRASPGKGPKRGRKKSAGQRMLDNDSDDEMGFWGSDSE